MVSDPILNEWISGLLAAIFSFGAVVFVSVVIGLVVIRIWGEDETSVSSLMTKAQEYGEWDAPRKISA
jgi:hypothetical protein